MVHAENSSGLAIGYTWRDRAAALLAVLAAALLMAPVARAAVVVTASVGSTVYGSGFLGTPSIAVAQTANVVNGGDVAGFPAEYGLDFATSATLDSFSFLQNQYCVGKCTTYALTTVTLTLMNTGTEAETMRFDSLITPGHLARLGINDDASAVFNFSVTETTDGIQRTLYSASGVADSTHTEITTSDNVAFNGLTRSSDGDAFDVLDWSATNIILPLDTLLPGQTSTLVYSSLTRTTTAASACTDIFDCAGVQVVFGDPRNNGGGANRVALFAAVTAPVIGQTFVAAEVPLDIVPLSAPLPPTPEVIAPPNYAPEFASQLSVAAVPEPATWLLMIAGFAIVGAASRRATAARGAADRRTAGLC